METPAPAEGATVHRSCVIRNQPEASGPQEKDTHTHTPTHTHADTCCICLPFLYFYYYLNFLFHAGISCSRTTADAFSCSSSSPALIQRNPFDGFLLAGTVSLHLRHVATYVSRNSTDFVSIDTHELTLKR